MFRIFAADSLKPKPAAKCTPSQTLAYILIYFVSLSLPPQVGAREVENNTITNQGVGNAMLYIKTKVEHKQATSPDRIYSDVPI